MKEDYEFKTTHTLGGRNFFATLNECIEWKKEALTKALNGLEEAYRNQRKK